MDEPKIDDLIARGVIKTPRKKPAKPIELPQPSASVSSAKVHADSLCHDPGFSFMGNIRPVQSFFLLYSWKLTAEFPTQLTSSPKLSLETVLNKML